MKWFNKLALAFVVGVANYCLYFSYYLNKFVFKCVYFAGLG